MKKHISLILALILALSLLAACGQPAEPTPTPTPEPTAEQTAAEIVESELMAEEPDPEPMTEDEATTAACADFISGDWDGSLRLYDQHIVSIDLDGRVWCDCQRNYSTAANELYANWPASLYIINGISTPADLYAVSQIDFSLDHYVRGEKVDSLEVATPHGEHFVYWECPKDGSDWLYATPALTADGLYTINYKTGELKLVADGIYAWALWLDENSDLEWNEPGSPQSQTGYANLFFKKAPDGPVYYAYPPDFEPHLHTGVSLESADVNTAEYLRVVKYNQATLGELSADEQAQMAQIRADYRDADWDGSFRLTINEDGSFYGVRVDKTSGDVCVNNARLGNISLADFAPTKYYGENVARFNGADGEEYPAFCFAENGVLTIYSLDDTPLVCELPEAGLAHKIIDAKVFHIGHSWDDDGRRRAFSVVLETTREDETLRLDIIRGVLDSSDDDEAAYNVWTLSDDERGATEFNDVVMYGVQSDLIFYFEHDRFYGNYIIPPIVRTMGLIPE